MNNASQYLLKLEKERSEPSSSRIVDSISKKKSRKSNTKSTLQSYVNKQQNRRSQIFKSIRPNKSISSNSFQHHTKALALLNGQCFRKGDIVRIIDSEDSQNYYAQITSILADVTAIHYVRPIFLIPKQGLGFNQENSNESDGLKFNPHLFEHGIVQPIIPLDVCHFECNCPLIPRYMLSEHMLIPFRRQKNKEYIQNSVSEIRQWKLMEKNSLKNLSKSFLSIDELSDTTIFNKPLAK